MNYWHLAGALLSAFGLSLCLHILRKKRQPKPMVCMLGADCNKVVKSEFSSFLGVGLEWREPLVALHLLGFALGIGGATVADLVFFRFMKDFYISESERDIIRSLSQALWVGLLVVVVSAIGLYLPAQAGEASFFWPEMALLFLIAVNDAIFCLVIMPRLVAAAGNHQVLRVAEVQSLRRVAFALGSASFVTWYAAFAAVLQGESGLHVGTFFGWYIAALVGALVLSQLVERRYYAPAPSMATF